MRIMLVCRVYSTHNRVGGMIHVIHERAHRLAQAGHDVNVVTTRSTEYAPQWVVRQHVGEGRSVAVYHCPSGQPQQYSDPFAEFCKEMCAELRPDILHLD